MIVKWFRVFGCIATVLISGVTILREPGQTASAASATITEPDPIALGRAYAPVLAKTYADGWVAAANALEEGKGVEECRQALQKAWRESREKAFRKKLLSEFSKVLPEGTEPLDATDRLRVAAFWKSFAGGLRAEP